MSTDADETVADLHRLFTGLSRLASRMRLRNAIHPGIRNLAQTDAWLLSHLAATGPAAGARAARVTSGSCQKDTPSTGSRAP